MQVRNEIQVKIKLLDVERVETFCELARAIVDKHPHLAPEIGEMVVLALNPKPIPDRLKRWSLLRYLRAAWGRHVVGVCPE